QLADRHAHELDRLVRRRPRLPLLDALRDEEPHPLAAEAGRRVEGGELAPRAAPQARLLLELAPRGREGLLAFLERPRRKLQQLLARRLPQLAHERHPLLRVDGDDRHRARVLDDLALVLAPALERDVDQLAVVHRPRLVGLHAASLSTSRRSSGPSHGGSPAAAFSPARSGRRVAGMTRSTRPSDSAHLRSACAHVSTPSSRSGSSSRAAGSRPRSRREREPSGRMTITARPSSAASGSSSRSHSRSAGLYGSCTVWNRPVRMARASSSKAAGA